MIFRWLRPPRNWHREIVIALNNIQKGIQNMSAELVASVDRLTSVVTDLEGKLTAEVAALAAAIAAAGVTDPDVTASVTRLNAISDRLTADAATLVQPAPTPAPPSA